MQLSSAIRAALIALTVTGAGLTATYADSGSIRFNVIKAGFVVGGSGGSGLLVFQGRSYPLAIGGVSYGFTFGASSTDFVGTVSNIRRPSDVNGVYGAAGAGIAVGPGAGGIVLTNQNAVLTLAGRQAGTDRRRRSQWPGDHAAVVCTRAADAARPFLPIRLAVTCTRFTISSARPCCAAHRPLSALLS